MRTNLAICVPFGDSPDNPRPVRPEWALSIACMSPPMNCNYVWLTVRGMQRDEARNLLVRQALYRNVRYILFLDDDTAPPNNTIHRLMYVLDNADDDVAACGGVYVTKSDPPVPTVIAEEGGGPFWRWKVGDVFPVARIGTGCLMIRADVFRKIPEPWFKDVKSLDEGIAAGVVPKEGEPGYDPELVKFEMTDDVYWCRKVTNAGYRLLAHGDVLPVHWELSGKAYMLPEGSYPVREMEPVPGSLVSGWMTEDELIWLRDTAREMQNVVEIGSWKGRSTRALCAGCPGTVFAVDHWRGSKGEEIFAEDGSDGEEAYIEFRYNTRDLRNLVPERISSLEAAPTFTDKFLDMVFIDGGHLYEEVKADIQAWLPKARVMICGHDYSERWPGVKQAVDELLGEVEIHGTIWSKRLTRV